MSRSSAGRPEQGARFLITRRASTLTWSWRRFSNGHMIAHGHAADLRQVLDQIERVSGGVVVDEERGPRKRLERAGVVLTVLHGNLRDHRVIRIPLEVLW